MFIEKSEVRWESENIECSDWLLRKYYNKDIKFVFMGYIFVCGKCWI